MTDCIVMYAYLMLVSVPVSIDNSLNLKCIALNLLKNYAQGDSCLVTGGMCVKFSESTCS